MLRFQRRGKARKLAMEAIAQVRFLFFLMFFYSRTHVMVSLTDHRDAMVLQSLKSSWRNTPANWNESDDPCGLPWTGVTCVNSRVTSLEIPKHRGEYGEQPPVVSLEGKLIDKIGDLTQLTTLYLFRNVLLIGPLTPRLGNLKNLVTLNLEGCRFTGNIPKEIGNLAHLSFLNLRHNNLSGKIPEEIGNLAHLSILDLRRCNLTGNIPEEIGNLAHLSLLFLDGNAFSGVIFLTISNLLSLEALSLSDNSLIGKIPEEIGNLAHLSYLYLDGNAFSGAIPSTISNLLNLKQLSLAQNRLSGALPDLSKMGSLSFLDLSDNSFDVVEIPAWFSTLRSLTTLVMTNGSLHGPFPTELLSLPTIMTVILGNNEFNGSLTIGGANTSSHLLRVNLVNNKISTVTLDSNLTIFFELTGNPVCVKALLDTAYCHPPYSTSLQHCGNKTCPLDQQLIPNSCTCDDAIHGSFSFPSTSFRDVQYVKNFRSLEKSLSDQLGMSPGSVYLDNANFGFKDGLQIDVALFPSNNSDIEQIIKTLTNHKYKPPQVFGAKYDFGLFYYD